MDSDVHTNMHLESFHRVLKHVYIKGKRNKRLDKLLFLLLKLSRDKSFERITKLYKVKGNTSRLRSIKSCNDIDLPLEPSIRTDTNYR